MDRKVQEGGGCHSASVQMDCGTNLECQMALSFSFDDQIVKM